MRIATFSNFIYKAFNLEILKNSRLPWVDYLKGLAIILVVYRHVFYGIQRSGIVIPDLLVTANMLFHSFRMPLFFILSGLFISKSIQKRKISELIELKFEKLLYPYFIWVFLQITFQLIFSNLTNADRSLIQYTYIFYQPKNLDQFWYLPALFNVTIFFILFKIKYNPNFLFQFILGLTFYFLSPYFHSISIISDFMEYYIFFVFGDYLAKFFFKRAVQNVFSNSFFLLFVIPFFVFSQLYYLRYDEYYYLNDFFGKIKFLFIVVTGCLFITILAFHFQKWNIFKFIRLLGFHSLQIYVMHVFAAAVNRLFFTKVVGVYDPTILILTGISVSLIIPLVVYNLFIKDGFLWFLFTYKKVKRNVN